MRTPKPRPPTFGSVVPRLARGERAMAPKRDESWLWLVLGIISMLLATVQFMDMLRKNDFLVDTLFFVLAFGATLYFFAKWARDDHRPPWDDPTR